MKNYYFILLSLILLSCKEQNIHRGERNIHKIKIITKTTTEPEADWVGSRIDDNIRPLAKIRSYSFQREKNGFLSVNCSVETKEDLNKVFIREYHPDIAERLSEIWYLKTFSRKKIYPSHIE